MNMKEHILAALNEQYQLWEELLASLSEEQITRPRFDAGWSIQDVLTHLWAWQQTSNARLETALYNREPEFPTWVRDLEGDWEQNVDMSNARIYEIYHKKAWPEIYQNWKNGFRRLLDLGMAITERDLLDSDRYEWLKGYSLAFVLVASYDHHQEHLDNLKQALQEK